MSSELVVPPVRVVFSEADRRQILDRVDSVLASGMVAGGRWVAEFEQLWASYTGVSNAVAVANGGSALQLLLQALEPAGGEVLVPTNTFIATVNAIVRAGGQPVFVDLDPETLSPSVDDLEACVTDKTVGVVVVHVGGIISSAIEELGRWCEARGLWLAEDAAHAHGSELRGRRAGAFGHGAAYSFFATKVMTTGEGGAVVTRHDALAERVRCLRDYGKRSAWESVHVDVEMNHRMTEIGAVLGLAQARRLDEFIASRQQAAAAYRNAFSGALELVLPADRCSWYKVIALLPDGVERGEFKRRMRELGVALPGGVYDLPVHLQPVFESRWQRGAFPRAERFCDRHVCLPIFAGMTPAQSEHVISSVRGLLEVMAS